VEVPHIECILGGAPAFMQGDGLDCSALQRGFAVAFCFPVHAIIPLWCLLHTNLA
jgi:hypothetical protein